MSRIVDEIVRRGWAQRRVDPADHRASVIGLTEAGEAILDAVRHDRTARLAAGLALLEPEEAAALLAALPALESSRTGSRQRRREQLSQPDPGHGFRGDASRRHRVHSADTVFPRPVIAQGAPEEDAAQN